MAAPLLLAAGVGEDGFFGVRALWQSARSAAAAHPTDSAAAFDRALAASPGSNGLLLSAIGAALRAQDRDRARALLTRFAAQGGALPAADAKEIGHDLGAPAGDPLLVALIANGAPVEPGSVAATVPAAMRLIEGVAYDDRSRTAYLSSVVGRTIYRVAGTTPVVLLRLTPDLGSPMAIAIDTRHRTLWAGLDPKAPGAPASSKGGLLELSFDGRTHRFVTAPKDVAIGDVMVAPDGTAYAGDGRSGAVYRCRPGCAALETVLAPGVLRSAQGMLLSPDGRKLYVADYAYGVAIIDLATGTAKPLRTAPGVAIDGLDGLAWRGGRIVAVQNGWQPARLIAIELDAAGERAVAARVLARSGALSNPTQVAATKNGALLVVANAQWDLYEKASEPGAVIQQPTTLLRIPPQ
jgi:DNA-binding beta-propeller fold protein YncE